MSTYPIFPEQRKTTSLEWESLSGTCHGDLRHTLSTIVDYHFIDSSKDHSVLLAGEWWLRFADMVAAVEGYTLEQYWPVQIPKNEDIIMSRNPAWSINGTDSGHYIDAVVRK